MMRKVLLRPRRLFTSIAHIKSEEAALLILALDKALGQDGLRFYPGKGYSHLLVWKNGPLKAVTVPPHDRIGQVGTIYSLILTS
jgi:2,3-bisphosphoglycerate-independent phosphoglycerate mutase